MKLTTCILCTCLSVLSCVVTTTAGVLRVPADFPTVRAAYSVAQDGDTIEMAAGVYPESAVEYASDKVILFRPSAGEVLIAPTTAGPVNDRVSGSLMIGSDSVTIWGENYFATDVTGEPTVFGHPAQYSVWYVWTAPFSGEAVVTASSSEFVPRVGVATRVAGFLEPLPEAYPYRQPSESAFFAQSGETYYVAVDTYDDRRGSFLLTLRLHPVSANDDFAQAIPLSGRIATSVATNVAATVEVGEPIHGGVSSGRSLWWNWTAPTNPSGPIRPVRLSTGSSDFDTVLAVYSGSAMNSLDLVAANDDAAGGGRHSELSFTPSSGTTYRIVVAGSSSAQVRHELDYGHVVLSLDYSALELRADIVSAQITPSRETDFQAQARIQNHGNATTGPLRVRVVARGARSPLALRTHPETPEQLLFLSSTLGGVAPGEERAVPFSGLCPAPIDGDPSTPPRLWAVSAQVEELFAGAWHPVDGAFVLFGDKPRRSGFVVDPGPLRSLDGTLVNPNVIQCYAFRIVAPSSLGPGQSASAQGEVQLSNGNRLILPEWESLAADFLTVDGDGMLRAAQVCSAAPSFRGGFSLAAEQWWATNSLRIVAPVSTTAQPSLLEISLPQPGVLQFRLAGKPCLNYAIEHRSEVSGQNGWRRLLTITAGIDGAAQFVDAHSPRDRQMIYRAVELP